MLEAGDGVGIARSDVHYVITEYGIAYLFGKSIRERALALIEVSHPHWREDLLKAAKKLGYVRADQYLASQAAYSVHEERIVTLKNGPKVMIRPARAADAGALQGLFHRLSEDRRQRLLFFKSHDQSRRGRFHGGARVSRGGPWNRAASVPSGVRYEARRARVCLRDPAAQR